MRRSFHRKPSSPARFPDGRSARPWRNALRRSGAAPAGADVIVVKRVALPHIQEPGAMAQGPPGVNWSSARPIYLRAMRLVRWETAASAWRRHSPMRTTERQIWRSVVCRTPPSLRKSPPIPPGVKVSRRPASFVQLLRFRLGFRSIPIVGRSDEIPVGFPCGGSIARGLTRRRTTSNQFSPFSNRWSGEL